MFDNRLNLPFGLLISATLVVAMVWPAGPAFACDAATVASLLSDPSPDNRAKGITLLEQKGHELLPELVEVMHTGSTPARRGAAIGLSLMPTPALAIDGLSFGLSDDDAVVRSLCAHGLGRIGSTAATETAQLLTHSDNRVRVGAALALSKMGAPAIPALVKMLELRDPAVTARTAWLLGIMGREALPAVPALIRAMETEDMRVLHVLAATIDAISPDPATVHHELTLLGRERINCPATRVGKAAAPTLIKLLARPGTPMANIALYSLARMGSEAHPSLKLALTTGNDSQKTAAALLLTSVDPELAHTLPEELRRSLSGDTRQQ